MLGSFDGLNKVHFCSFFPDCDTNVKFVPFAGNIRDYSQTYVVL